MKTSVFGYSSLGLPIIAYEFRNSGPEVLILGGVHGDEVEGVFAAQALLNHFMMDFPYHLNLVLVPQFNIEGVLNKTRGNAKGIDLNRNLKTKDWSAEIKTPRYHPGPSAGSEPENQGLMKYIDEKKPRWILSLHSWHPILNVNGDCHAEAEILARHTGYKIDAEIGYPTPGCLGTYAGLERQSPTLTYEIQRGQNPAEILKIHVPAILEALKATEKRK